jgi:GcrA cell cycle regulator
LDRRARGAVEEALGRGVEREPDRGAAGQRHPQRGDRQGPQTRAVGSRHHLAHEEPSSAPAHGRETHAKSRFSRLGNPAFRGFTAEAEAYSAPVEELVIPGNERKYIQTLTECCCRWPIGDPQTPEFHFCGKKKVPGLPYCEFHARRAFQPPQARRREREIAEPIPHDAVSRKETA